MNGFDPETFAEDVDESAEYDDEDYTEAIEAAESDDPAEFLPFLPFPPLGGLFGGGRKPGTRPATGQQSYYKTPTPPMLVTQAQLKTALERVQKDVRANTAGVKAVETRVATVQSVQARHTKELAKQNATNAKQAKAIAGVRAELKKARDTSLIMYLMSRPKGTSPSTADNSLGQGVTIPKDHKVLIAPAKDDSILLPLMLMGGLGGDGGGGDNSLLMALALTGGLG